MNVTIMVDTNSAEQVQDVIDSLAKFLGDADPVAPAKVAPAPAKKAAAKKAAPKPAPEPEPEVDDEDDLDEPEVDEDAPTVADAIAAAKKAVAADQRPAVRAALKAVGAAKASELTDAQAGDFIEALDEAMA